MIAVDWVGVSAAISALFAGVVSVIVALRQGATKQAVDAVHEQVATPNGSTIGEIVAANDLREH